MTQKKITLFAVSMLCWHTVWDRLEQKVVETSSRDVICYTLDKSKAEEIKALYSDSKAQIKEQKVSSAELSKILDNLEYDLHQTGVAAMWNADEFSDFRMLFAA